MQERRAGPVMDWVGEPGLGQIGKKVHQRLGTGGPDRTYILHARPQAYGSRAKCCADGDFQHYRVNERTRSSAIEVSVRFWPREGPTNSNG